MVTFGEIMVRLAPPGYQRFAQAVPGRLEVTLAGAEVNVAASLARLGRGTAFVTALPPHAIADAVVAYGELCRDGKSPEDIAARFGVALSYVKKVLRLSALHPDALICLAHDKIGMEAAQALTLTDDHERQLEALKRCGNSGHQIRRMLTEEKVGTTSALFLFVGTEAYAAAGGTITADLFAEDGNGYADDPALVETLAIAKMAEIEAGHRAEGWQDVRASLQRPDDYYNLVTVHAEGKREPTEAEQAERARIQDAADARLAEAVAAADHQLLDVFDAVARTPEKPDCLGNALMVQVDQRQGAVDSGLPWQLVQRHGACRQVFFLPINWRKAGFRFAAFGSHGCLQIQWRVMPDYRGGFCGSWPQFTTQLHAHGGCIPATIGKSAPAPVSARCVPA